MQLTFYHEYEGIVVPVQRDGVTKMESFHVRVLRVEPGSAGYKNKITTQMFVQSMSLVDGERVGVPVTMGASTARVYISPEDRVGDVWRESEHVVPNNTLDLDLLMRPIESVLSTSMLFRKQIQVNFIKYKQ